MSIKCPRCSGFISRGNDGYEDYLFCEACSREFNLNMTPRRMTPKELYTQYGIRLTPKEEYASMERNKG